MKKIVIIVSAIIILLGVVGAAFAFGFTNQTSLSLNKTEVSLCVGDSTKLIATASDKKAEVEWSTSDETVATVRRGTITAVGVGTATITASLEDGTSASCTVKVSERVLSISQTTATINLDESNMLTLTATSSDNGEITWKSSDPNIATVVNGVVRAYDLGNVTITAQCGSSVVACEITIIMPSLPEDYYKVEKKNNSSVLASPGTWYYHADGMEGSDFDFSEYPVHQNNTVSATLSKIPNVAGKQYFYLRYQPDEVEVGSYYTINVTITVSESTKLKISSKRADGSTEAAMYKTFEAGVPQTIEYVGCRNLTEPFWIRLHQAIDAESFSITVQLNSITPHDGKNLPSYHTKDSGSGSGSGGNTPTNPPLDNGYYLESGKNAVVIADPGKWYYFCDGNSGSTGEYELDGTPKFENGVLSYAFKTMATLNSSGKEPNYQFRYQPAFAVGTKYKVTFTVTVDAAGEVIYGYDSGVSFVFEEAGTKTITWTGTVASDKPFFIGLRSADRTAPISMTVSDISFEENPAGDEPGTDEPEVNNELESGKNSVVVANPGKWYYFCDGNTGATGAYELAATPKFENGVLTFSFNTMAELSSAGKQPNYQLRYQPNLAVGTTYTVTFTVTVDAAGEVICGFGTENTSYEFTEAGTKTITWTGAVQEGNPFFIGLRSADRTAPITLTVSDISFTEGIEEPTPDPDPNPDPDEPVVDNYEIESGKNSVVVADPGKWYYSCDTGYEFASTPKFENGVITFAFNYMNGETSPSYQLRYQPEFAVGTNVMIKFTVQLSAAGKVYCGTDSSNRNYYTFNEAGTQTIIWTGKVHASESFRINVRSTDRSAPITMTVSDIEIIQHDTHTEETIPAIDATCTETGLTTGVKCSVCGEILTAQTETPALGHNMGAYVQTIAPTCTTKGEERSDCTRCDHFVIKELDVISHTEEIVAGKDATCTATGLTAGVKCSVCGETLTAQTVIAAAGHAWGDWIVDIPATEEAEGTKHRKCANCDETENGTIPALDHEHSYDAVVTAPTCTEQGYTTHTCRCNDSYIDSYVLALGHTEETVAGKDATCTEDGLTAGKKCSVCGVTTLAQEEIPALGHTDETIAGKDATCTETGLTDGKKCSVCGVTTLAQEAIPANGHTNDGITCTVCGKVNYELVNGNNATVLGNPGRWYYSLADTPAVTPNYYDGTIILSFDSMSTGNVNNQIRFVPVLSEGVTEYTITFTVELSAMGDVYCGTDSNHRDYHNDLAAGTYTISWTGAVHASESFRINVRSEDRTAPITMTVSNIVIEEKQAEPTPDPEEPEISSKIVVNISDLELETTTVDELVPGTGIYAAKDLAINSNSKTVDGFTFTKRLQLGGKMAINSDGSVKATMKVVTNGPAKIIAYVISSSGTAERTFQAATLEDGQYNVFYTEAGIQGKDAQRVEFTVDAAGTYYFGSASSGMNVYYVEVQPIN